MRARGRYPDNVTVHLVPVDAAGTDRSALRRFLTTETFPFHVVARPTPEQVDAAIDAGAWGGADTETLWIDHPDHGRIGVLRLQDVNDPTVMLDLRLAERWRGRGLGAEALDAAAGHIFRTRPSVLRFEGQTRADNVAMRRTFSRRGWVQEAHYRDGWPIEGGEPVASVAYALMRRDRDSRAVPDAIRRAWEAEEQLLTPGVRSDPARVGALLAEGFVEIGQSGRRWTRDEIVAALVHEPGVGDAVVSDREARMIGPDLVLLEYRVRFDGRDSRRAALWRCDPHPRCVFHQGTAVGGDEN